jgi:phosphatase NudJ
VSIFSHDIYENIRTRTIVLHEGCLLLHPPQHGDEKWHVPGGGLEPHESLAECARREVLEETGIAVRVGSIAFLQEWIVPRETPALESGEGYGFGLEVFHYAYPLDPAPRARPEFPGDLPARWVPLTAVAGLPLWPKELKDLCLHLHAGRVPCGSPTFAGHAESPWLRSDHDPFAPTGDEHADYRSA